MAWSPEGLRVVEVPERGPSHRAGLRPGDRIVAIDGEPVSGMAMAEVLEHLRGPVGSQVRISFVRGHEQLTATVSRAPYLGE